VPGKTPPEDATELSFDRLLTVGLARRAGGACVTGVTDFFFPLGTDEATTGFDKTAFEIGDFDTSAFDVGEFTRTGALTGADATAPNGTGAGAGAGAAAGNETP